MKVEILAKSMKPYKIYSLVSQLQYFVWSSSQTLSVLIRSQEKRLYYTFILSEN